MIFPNVLRGEGSLQPCDSLTLQQQDLHPHDHSSSSEKLRDDLFVGQPDEANKNTEHSS